MNKAVRMIVDKGFRFDILVSRNLLFWMTDRQILEKQFFYHLQKRLNLDAPQTFQEKLQWLKLYDQKPIYTTMVDKYLAKAFIAEKIGKQYVIEPLGVWDHFDEIDFDKLPDQFVLKCTHDSGGLIICRDKSKLDLRYAKKKLEKCLRRNYYYVSREWPYKGVKPRIIAEKYLEDKEDGELRDYKFFTFSGNPRILYITQGQREKKNVVADFFDMDFNHLDLTMDHVNAKELPHPPQNFVLMKKLAGILSQGTPHLRVDFYEVNGKVYVGELTFFHCTGTAPVQPESWNKKLGDWIMLPEQQ